MARHDPPLHRTATTTSLQDTADANTLTHRDHH
jgi:hypothetical protein